MLIAGIAAGERHAAAGLVRDGRLVGVCAQERVTRVRSAGVAEGQLPVEALELLLDKVHATPADVGRYALVDGRGEPPPLFESVDYHRAHAATAYFTSSFPAAAIVVCDDRAPEVSVWAGQGPSLRPVDLTWQGPGFATVLSRCARALGLGPVAADLRLEALARLTPSAPDPELSRLVRRDGGRLIVESGLEDHLRRRLESARDLLTIQSALAAAIHARIGELLLEYLAEVRVRLGLDSICLGGGLFHRSSIITLVKQAGIFRLVFVPIDPGDSGLAVGAALASAGVPPTSASPFLGPDYSAEAIKQVLDNCKLQYAWESDESALDAAIQALRDGHLVGWFDGPMEWGSRALGARSILANPAAPYVLENLNHFLKRREAWRGYALSGTKEAVANDFDGPADAPFMECEFRPKDPARFRGALPSPSATIRIQTVAADFPSPRFRRLLEMFGEATGSPYLVNTSFNGFHEPIVCSPRDAVRVFYGTGIDVLVMNRFVLRK